MIDYIKGLYNKDNNEELYVFNVTHTICIVAMLVVCFITHFFLKKPEATYISFGFCVLFFLTMVEANRTMRLKLSLIFMSVAFNFLYVPAFFFMFDRRISVMPAFFLFGLMYSVILLDSKTAILLGSLETLFFTALLFTAAKNMTPAAEFYTPKDIEHLFLTAVIAIVFVGLCAGTMIRFRLMFFQKAQKRAEDMKAEAMDAYVAKDMFLINMSHEIRTPMNAIVGTVDLLLDQEVNERVSDSVYNILNSCNALLSITNELMDLSRSENGDIEVFTSTYDLADILMEVINMMTVRLTESNLEFFVNINKNIPRFLLGDASKLRQLFVNLLNNAVKFTETGKIILRVDYRLVDNESIELIVDVEDTGIGIKREKMADLFVRTDSSVSSEDAESVEGAGLGLAICAEILKEMGGEISVKSQYKSGSVFTFRVPQKFTSLDTVAFIPDSSMFRVLIFEKDPENAAHVRKILEDFNIESDNAANSQDIERLLNINRYSHVFVSNERYEECERVMRNRLVSEKVIAFLDIDDNVQVSRASTVLTRPIHALNIAALLKNETNSHVRDITRKGGFECPHATILVVDDNYTNLSVAGAILQKYNANVITALSGKDCLRILKDQDVDMIFLDYMMPEMNGIDTLENIRKIPGSKYTSMPVIALTANVVSGAREMFLEAGFDDFLAKPISIDKMEKILRKYLRKELIVAKRAADTDEI